MMRYKNLFIDLDDTLWDTYHNNKKCLEGLYADLKWDKYFASFEAFFDIYMPNNDRLWAEYRNNKINKQTLVLERFGSVLRPIGITKREDILAINKEFLKYTGDRTGRLIEGAIDLLEYLRPSYKMYILSNGFKGVQEQKMRNSGIYSYFQKIILSEDAGIHKPHKEIFDFALKNTNSQRTETLMIGDCWEADIEGARRSKIDQLWFNPKGLEEKDCKPTFTVKSLVEIKNIL